MPDKVARVEEWESTVDDRVLKLPDSEATVEVAEPTAEDKVP